MSERRYSEREIREVFERAARDQEQAETSAAQDGLTLHEMQEIAASAGIAPEFVARAAQSVAHGEPEQGRMNFGPIPRGVFRTEFLPGPPTESLWNELVADLRRTFSTHGTVSEVGTVREWHNGNLRVTLEPAGSGSRLHLRTRRDRVSSQVGATTMLSGVGLILILMSTIDTDAGLLAFGAAVLVACLIGTGVLWSSQRTWASIREQQMEALAQRASARSQDHALMPPPQLDPSLLDLDAPETDGLASASRTRS